MKRQLIAIFDLDRTLYHDFDRMELHAPKDMARQPWTTRSGTPTARTTTMTSSLATAET